MCKQMQSHANFQGLPTHVEETQGRTKLKHVSDKCQCMLDSARAS